MNEEDIRVCVSVNKKEEEIRMRELARQANSVLRDSN
jgi:hypothetical protein